MQDLQTLLPAVVDLLPDSDEVREALVFSAYRKTAGESLCRHSKPIGLSGKELQVAVRDETWSRHLSDLAHQLVFKINNFMRSEVVKRIDFRIDSDQFPDLKTKPSDEEAKIADVEKELGEKIESIDDEELRRVVLETAASYLEKKKDGR